MQTKNKNKQILKHTKHIYKHNSVKQTKKIYTNE